MDNAKPALYETPNGKMLLEAQEHLRKAAELLTLLSASDDDDYSEQLADIGQEFGKTCPFAFTTQVFWPLLGQPDVMTSEDMIKAIRIAETIGPDYLNKFRRMGKFMAESQNA